MLKLISLFIFSLLLALALTACGGEPQDFPPPPSPTAVAETAEEATATPVPPTAAEPVQEATATPVPTATAKPVEEATASPTPTSTDTPPPPTAAVASVPGDLPVALIPPYLPPTDPYLSVSEMMPAEMSSEASNAFLIAITNYIAGANEEALARLDEAIALDPEFALAYQARAILAEEDKKLDQALGDYNKALEIDPTLNQAYFQRGRLQAELGSTDQALTDFSQAIELAPAEAEAYLNRGYLYLQTGQAQEAFTDLDKALALEPENAQAYLYRGMARRGLGETERAVADFSAAIELESELAEAYANRGLAYQALGEGEKALTDYQQALQLGLHPELRNQVDALVDALAGGQLSDTTEPDEPTPTLTAIPAPPSGSTLEVQLDQPFMLYIGQTAHLAEGQLSLTFQEVLEDSRCPSQVNCAWAGQAIVAVTAEQEGSAPGEFELNNNPPLKQDRVFYGGYLIRFAGLDPYPEYPDTPILPEEYQVTLVVSKGD